MAKTQAKVDSVARGSAAGEEVAAGGKAAVRSGVGGK